MLPAFKAVAQRLADPHSRGFQASMLAGVTVVFVMVEALSFSVAGARPEGQYTVQFLSKTERRVTSVTAAARRDGLRVGDLYDWARGTSAQCIRRFSAQRVGQSLQLPVQGRAGVRAVNLRVGPMSYDERIGFVLTTAFKVAGMLVGILLVARGAGRFGYYSGLAFFGTASIVGESNNAILWYPTQVILYGGAGAVAALFLYLQVAAALDLCATPRTLSWLVSIPALGLAFYLAFTREEYIRHALADPCHSTTASQYYYYCLITLWLLPLFVYAGAALDVRGHETLAQPFLPLWMIMLYCVGSIGPVTNLYHARQGGSHPHDVLLNATYPAMAVGFVLVALGHRRINVRWFVNRAITFGATATLLTVLFSAIELIAARVGADFRSGQPNLFLELVIAIPLALLFRPLHKIIENVLEQRFFRRRHSAERAYSRLSRELHHIDDADRTAERLVNEVQYHTGADAVAYYQCDQHADNLCMMARSSSKSVDFVELPNSIRLDNVGVLQARSESRPVDLSKKRSGIAKFGYLFPVILREKLFGALVCADSVEANPIVTEDLDLIANASKQAGVRMWRLTHPRRRRRSSSR